MTRRDRCHFTGLRAGKLSPAQAAAAWDMLSVSLIELGATDVPKFSELLRAIRMATIHAKAGIHINPEWVNAAAIDVGFDTFAVKGKPLAFDRIPSLEESKQILKDIQKLFK